MSDDTELAGVFNDYFINIAANLKEPIDYRILMRKMNSTVTDQFLF